MQPGYRAGRYVLTAKFATGGMAEVWLAEATGASGFKKSFILKFLLPKIAADPESVRMFVAEALLGSRLDHPNIVPVHDHGIADDAHFIAMELVVGRTLREIAIHLKKTSSTLPEWVLLRTAISVCDALEYAHLMRDDDGTPLHIVHRDVTPENIMVSINGVTKVLDFGIAKLSSSDITATGTIKGKLAYVAPERILGRETNEPDPRIDLYSLGVVLYEMLCGSRPYHGATPVELFCSIVRDEPVPPSQVAAGVSPAIEAVCLRAMAKNPDERYQTAAEMRTAMESILVALDLHPNDRQVADFLCQTFGSKEALATPITRLASSSSSSRSSAPPEAAANAREGTPPPLPAMAEPPPLLDDLSKTQEIEDGLELIEDVVSAAI
jgi:serine/threonine protein kinase